MSHLLEQLTRAIEAQTPEEGTPPHPPRHRLIWALLVGVLGTAFVLLTLSLVEDYGRKVDLDRHFPDRAVVALDVPTATTAAPGEGPGGPSLLRVAIAPVITPERSIVEYQALVDYLAAAVGRKGHILTRSTYAEVNELVRTHRCDLALVCTYSFIRGEIEFGMELLAAPVVRGAADYHSYLIVPLESDARDLYDLKGRTFGSADSLSTSGWLYTAVSLMEDGHNPLTFFSRHVITGSHNRSVFAVASGEVDGAAVDSIVFDQMAERILEKVRVIHTSPPFAMPPMVTHANPDPVLREGLLNALLRAHEDPHGREALKMIDIDRFRSTDTTAYESVRALAARWEPGK